MSRSPISMPRSALTQPRRINDKSPAIYFYGPSVGYVNLGFTVTYTPSDSFTWECFAKFQTPSATATIVGCLYEAGTNDPIAGINVTTGGLVNVGLRDLNNLAPGGNSTTRCDDNKWHHIAMVRNVSTDRLDMFIDGTRELNNTDSTTGNIQLGAAVFAGARNARGTPDQYFKGSVQYLRFSNTARYTANFTKPSYNAPYGVDAATTLLFKFTEAPSTPVDSTAISTASIVNQIGKDFDGYFVAP